MSSIVCTDKFNVDFLYFGNFLSEAVDLLSSEVVGKKSILSQSILELFLELFRVRSFIELGFQNFKFFVLWSVNNRVLSRILSTQSWSDDSGNCIGNHLTDFISVRTRVFFFRRSNWGRRTSFRKLGELTVLSVGEVNFFSSLFFLSILALENHVVDMVMESLI